MNVVLTGGGTGGHIYPALAIAEGLAEQPGAQPLRLCYVGTRDRLEATLVPQAGIPIFFVRAAPLVRRLSPLLVRTLVANAVGIVQSLAVLHRARPDVIVATGGYVAFPVLVAARIVRVLGRSRVRIALLEPNAAPGLTHRLIAPLADERWLGVADLRSPADGRTLLTGTPVRASLERPPDRIEAYAEFGLDPGGRTVLVMGGSQGARSLCAAVVALASDPAMPADWQIILITGRDAYAEVAAAAAATPAAGRLRVVAYLADPRTAYAAADLTVARAGASTLAELAALGMPALLIPYPHATDDHQTKNAQASLRRGAARLLADRDLSGERLRDELLAAFMPETLAALRTGAARPPGPSVRLALAARATALGRRAMGTQTLDRPAANGGAS